MTLINLAHPAAVLILGALLIPFLSGRARKAYLVLLPLVSLMNMLSIGEGMHFHTQFLGFDIIPARVDKMSMLFGIVFHIAATLGMVFALGHKDTVQHVAAMIYAGGALGVAFAGDLLTLFLFWESLTVSAAVIIWSRRSKESQGAGFRYLLVHAVGGLILLAGIVTHASRTGSLAFDYIGLDSPGGWLIFIGFGVNAAWPVLHAWLVDAYPAATASGTVFLSAFTTKSAVYALARAFPGAEPLIWIGGVMVIFTIFYAVIENDLRKTLSYSLINHVGFMMVAVGIGTEMAINGACAHAFVHIIYKGLLFMCLGAVLTRTGSTRATDLGGLCRSMPWTCGFCLVGAAATSALPYFSGFAAKSLIMQAAAEGHMTGVWLLLLFASAGVLLHSGFKIPYFAFFGKDSGLRPQEAPWHMLLAMGAAAFLCVYIGVFPGPLYELLPYAVDYTPYTAAHVLSQIQLLLFAGLGIAMLLLAGLYPAAIRAQNLDVDVLYRKAALAFARIMDRLLNGLNRASEELLVTRLTGRVNALFQDMPQRLAAMALSPFWLASGLPPNQRRLAKAKLKATIDLGASPIGLTAMAAVAVAAVIIFFMLAN